jgi:dihydroorotase
MIKDANWKMNPPLRSEENRLETIKALLNKTAMIIASDHAPHTIEEKSQEYDKCPNGIIGLETMIPLVYTNLIKTGIATYNDFLDWLVYNPIKVFGLPERKLEIGYTADLAVLDIKTIREYTSDEILSLGKNSPYIGMKLTGFCKYTIVNGKLVWNE